MAEPRVELTFRHGEVFDARSPEGASFTLDGDAKEGLSPMQSLLASVAGCMGVDVVLILKKMRAEPSALSIAIEGERLDEPPRRYTEIRIRFRVTGAVPEDKAERAVALSLEKYCSVFHTLRPDLTVATAVEVVTPSEA